MKSIFRLILLVIMYFCLIGAEQHIRYAAVIYRHGDRTPVDLYPTDPYKNESLWPERFGELTNLGKQQHYALGKYMKSRYREESGKSYLKPTGDQTPFGFVYWKHKNKSSLPLYQHPNPDLIPQKFDPLKIYALSSDVDRTLMSAMVNLAGMYPPRGSSVWNPKLLWQPLPVHSTPTQQDPILAMMKPCKNYDEEYNRVKNSPEYKKRLEKYKDLMSYLSKYVGYEVKDYADILNIYSGLKIEALYNFTLPKWTSKVYPDQLFEPACYSFRTQTATLRMTRLRIGPFLKEVMGNMIRMLHHYNSKLPDNIKKYEYYDPTPPKLLNIYSAHDLNIGSILNGLGLYDGRCPEYTSAIFFELVYDDAINIHEIKIYYRNTTRIQEPVQLAIPNCNGVCSLERFLELYNDIIPDDWEKECNMFLGVNFLRLDLVLTVVAVTLISIASSFIYFFYRNRFIGKHVLLEEMRLYQGSPIDNCQK